MDSQFPGDTGEAPGSEGSSAGRSEHGSPSEEVASPRRGGIGIHYVLGF